MERYWIMFWRKIDTSEVFNDERALRVFIYLLCNVDRKTGSMKIGRFWLSERLGLNSNTLYKILKRLEKKYKMVTQSSNNRFTTIALLNWSKYQLIDKMVTQSSNNQVTTGQQPSNTLQEVDNKRNNKRETIQKKPPLKNNLIRTIDYLSNIPIGDMTEFREKTNATEKQIRDKAEDLIDYCEAHGKEYKNYRAFLKKALRKDFPKRAFVDDKWALGS